MTRERRLLIDDVRMETDPKINCRLDVIARNYWTGIFELANNPPWDVLFLDHDLSSFDDETGREYTGYDIMLFLEANTQFMPKKIVVVSSNPSGAARIKAAIAAIEARRTE